MKQSIGEKNAWTIYTDLVIGVLLFSL